MTVFLVGTDACGVFDLVVEAPAVSLTEQIMKSVNTEPTHNWREARDVAIVKFPLYNWLTFVGCSSHFVNYPIIMENEKEKVEKKNKPHKLDEWQNGKKNGSRFSFPMTKKCMNHG